MNKSKLFISSEALFKSFSNGKAIGGWWHTSPSALGFKMGSFEIKINDYL